MWAVRFKHYGGWWCKRKRLAKLFTRLKHTMDIILYLNPTSKCSPLLVRLKACFIANKQAPQEPLWQIEWDVLDYNHLFVKAKMYCWKTNSTFICFIFFSITTITTTNTIDNSPLCIRVNNMRLLSANKPNLTCLFCWNLHWQQTFWEWSTMVSLQDLRGKRHSPPHQ